jgi:hypothetical protein
MRPTRLLLAAFAAIALSCASARSAPAPAAPAPPRAAAGAVTAVAPVARGMDAAEVRRLLGDPARVERIPSVAARGAGYERWIYRSGGADREIVLLEGKVVDLLP